MYEATDVYNVWRNSALSSLIDPIQCNRRRYCRGNAILSSRVHSPWNAHTILSLSRAVTDVVSTNPLTENSTFVTDRASAWWHCCALSRHHRVCLTDFAEEQGATTVQPQHSRRPRHSLQDSGEEWEGNEWYGKPRDFYYLVFPGVAQGLGGLIYITVFARDCRLYDTAWLTSNCPYKKRHEWSGSWYHERAFAVGYASPMLWQLAYPISWGNTWMSPVLPSNI